MRFLIPVVVVIVTLVFLPRPPAGPSGETVTEAVYPGSQVMMAEPAGEAADYDKVVEESGLLNRLELLDF